MAEAPIGQALTSILNQLPKLSAADLAKVEQALKLAKSFGSAPVAIVQHGVAEPWAELILDCIVEVTRETIGYPIGKDTLRGMTAYQSFRKKLPGLIEFIEHAASEHHQRRAIIKLGVELLFGYLHRPDRLIGPTTLMHQIHRLPEALNSQFPGYAGAGLLGFIAPRRERA